MKNRLPIIITSSLLIVGFIIGTFLDLPISQAIFSDRNIFGITLTALGLIPGYALIAFIGGALFEVTYRGKQPKWLKIILYIVSVSAIGIATYFSGNEFFSVNGFNIPGVGMILLADGISLLIDLGFFYIGLHVAKSNTNDKAWIALLIIGVAIIIALVPGVTIVKSIFHRPRYRLIQMDESLVYFHQWYEPCLNYKDFLTDTIQSEEFKSFPSGHAGTSMLVPFFLCYLTVFVPKLRKYHNLLFFAGFAYCCLISFARMLVGAHFLSDVCAGGLITMLFMVVADEVIIRLKLLDL